MYFVSRRRGSGRGCDGFMSIRSFWICECRGRGRAVSRSLFFIYPLVYASRACLRNLLP